MLDGLRGLLNSGSRYAVKDVQQFLSSMASPGETARLAKFFVDSLLRGEFADPQKTKNYGKLGDIVKKNHSEEHQSMILEQRKYDSLVILIPGYLEHPRMYFYCVDSFKEDGIHHSYWAHAHHFMNIEANAEYILDLGEYLMGETGKKSVNLIGHSRGGLIALKAAVMHPYIFDKVITVGAPVHGTFLADVFYKTLEKTIGRRGIRLLELAGYNLEPIKEMFFNSEFTRKLKENIGNLEGPEIYSIFTSGSDEAVIPGVCAVIDKHDAINIDIDDYLDLKRRPGHIGLALHDKVHELELSILKNRFDKKRFRREHIIMTFNEYLDERRMDSYEYSVETEPAAA